MKRCPKCGRSYADETQNFCLDDGAWLTDASASSEPQTAIMPGLDVPSEPQTRILATDAYAPTVSMSGYQPNSIAVLPFAHLSSDPDDEYFCDGLAEELINALSRVDDLKVVARTSAFSFKGKNIDIAQVGSALNVNNVVEGSVRKFGDRMRISVSLTSTADGFNIWSDKYDTEMRDIFDVQDEIALSVVSALKTKLLGKPGETEQMAALIEDLKHYRTNVEAYQLYLRGRFFFNKFTPDDYYRALEFFHKALEIDADYAAAYAGIADVHTWLTEFGPVPPREGMPKAKEAALKAISLDPDLSEAHASLALVLQEFDHDFAEAEAEYKKAVELNPNDSMAQQYYGALLAQLGRFAEAESRFRKALEIDPKSAAGNWVYPFGLFWEKRYDESIDRAEKILEIDPNFSAAFLVLSFDYQMKNEFAASVEAYARFLEMCGVNEMAAIARNAFKREGWSGYLRAMTAPDARAAISSYIAAVYFAALDDNESAIACLQESLDKREGYLVMLKVDPRMEVLHDDARFQQILKAVGFVE